MRDAIEIDLVAAGVKVWVGVTTAYGLTIFTFEALGDSFFPGTTIRSNVEDELSSECSNSYKVEIVRAVACTPSLA